MIELDKNTFMTDEEIAKGVSEAKSACVVVLNPTGDGSILAVTKRKEFGNIGLPGGKIDLEVGESPQAAAVRECLEETGILVEESSLVPIYAGLGRTMISMTFLSQEVLGGKLHCMTREGLPMWVNFQALLRDECSYKHYNLKLIERLLKANVWVNT